MEPDSNACPPNLTTPVCPSSPTTPVRRASINIPNGRSRVKVRRKPTLPLVKKEAMWILEEFLKRRLADQDRLSLEQGLLHPYYHGPSELEKVDESGEVSQYKRSDSYRIAAKHESMINSLLMDSHSDGDDDAPRCQSLPSEFKFRIDPNQDSESLKKDRDVLKKFTLDLSKAKEAAAVANENDNLPSPAKKSMPDNYFDAPVDPKVCIRSGSVSSSDASGDEWIKKGKKKKNIFTKAKERLQYAFRNQKETTDRKLAEDSDKSSKSKDKTNSGKRKRPKSKSKSKKTLSRDGSTQTSTTSSKSTVSRKFSNEILDPIAGHTSMYKQSGPKSVPPPEGTVCGKDSPKKDKGNKKNKDKRVQHMQSVAPTSPQSSQSTGLVNVANLASLIRKSFRRKSPPTRESKLDGTRRDDNLVTDHCVAELVASQEASDASDELRTPSPPAPVFAQYGAGYGQSNGDHPPLAEFDTDTDVFEAVDRRPTDAGNEDILMLSQNDTCNSQFLDQIKQLGVLQSLGSDAAGGVVKVTQDTEEDQFVPQGAHANWTPEQRDHEYAVIADRLGTMADRLWTKARRDSENNTVGTPDDIDMPAGLLRVPSKTPSFSRTPSPRKRISSDVGSSVDHMPVSVEGGAESDMVDGGATSRTSLDRMMSIERHIAACLGESGDRMSEKHKFPLDSSVCVQLGQVTAYDVFKTTIQQALGSEVGWNQIAMLFHITKSVVNAVGAGGAIALSIKENSLLYIEDKFAEWIMNQGGWDSMLEETDSELDLD